MPLQATSGAASYDAFGGGVPAEPNYIESCFSTWLYTGTGANQTITNGIDLAGKGGLVWLKARSQASTPNMTDTVRGAGKLIYPNLTNAEATGTWGVNSFNSNGFGITGADGANNGSGTTYASWTFREQPKFFDVVTYSGNSVSGRLISHNLGSAPGCIIIKCTNLTGTNWAVWHRSLGTGFALQLQGTNAAFNTKPQWFNSSTQGSSTTFEVGNDTDTNETGNTYVAYLFAHNAGGFGLTGTDNVISCGSYTGNGSNNGPVVTLGYEPQWLLIKRATGGVGNWVLFDNMRGMPVGGIDATLLPNTADAEGNTFDWLEPTATGFQIKGTFSGVNTNGDTYIYIAIRRGPMRTPTTGTSVFQPVANTTTYTPPNVIGSLNADWFFGRRIDDATNWFQSSKLTLRTMPFNATAAEQTTQYVTFTNTGVRWIETWATTPTTYRSYLFQRAPGFFDVVCYTGTGSGAVQTLAHNLTVVPEMMIVKCRSASGDSWMVYHSAIGNTRFLQLNSTAATGTFALWNNTTPTATQFTVGNDSSVNASGQTYVTYLFASCPGVSRVGTYAGTDGSQSINCGFTAGARFVLIKRTSSSGGWYVFDTARGFSSEGFLLLNSSAAEGYTPAISTLASGFTVTQTGEGLNAAGQTYIFLAIA